MVELVAALELAGYALGALGALLVFFEFFQMPSYLNYTPEHDDYTVDVAPMDVTEHTWVGRVGAFLVAVAFALQFLATLVVQVG